MLHASQVALVIILLAGAVFGGTSLYRYLTSRRRLGTIWQRVADHFRLRYAEESFGQTRSISGTIDDFMVCCEVVERPDPHVPNQQLRYSRVWTHFPQPLDLELRVHRSDPKEGDVRPGFDTVALAHFEGRFLVESRSPEQVEAFLNDELRERMLNYDSTIAKLQLDDQGILYEQLGVLENPDRIKQLVDSQLWLMRAMWNRKGLLDAKKETMP